MTRVFHVTHSCLSDHETIISDLGYNIAQLLECSVVHITFDTNASHDVLSDQEIFVTFFPMLLGSAQLTHLFVDTKKIKTTPRYAAHGSSVHTTKTGQGSLNMTENTQANDREP